MLTVRSSSNEIVKISGRMQFLTSSRVWDLFYEMYHLKLPTSKSRNAFNLVHAVANYAALYSAIAMLWQCSKIYLGRGCLT